MSQRVQQGQPMIILGKDSQCISGQNAQSMNIAAGRVVAEAIHMTPGSKGIDEMLVDSGGQVIVTNNGVAVLKEMDINHPTANMIVEVSGIQEDEVGDGAITAVINAGELLDQARNLPDSDVHATIIAQGYYQVAEKVKEVLEDNAIETMEDDRETLTKIAATAMIDKGAGSARDLLSELVVGVMLAVKDDDGIDTNNISIEKVVGGTIDNPELVEGVIVDKERTDENMPHAVEDANIAILDDVLEVCKTEIGAEVNVTSPDRSQQFPDQEEKQLKEMVDQLVEVGAGAVFAGDDIDNMAQHYPAKEDTLAARHTKSFDPKCLARTTGGCIVSSFNDIEADDLGFAGSVGQKDVDDDERTFAEGVEGAESVALILRGGTEHVVGELERAVEDPPGVAHTMLKDGKVLPGGGAPETELSLQLREFADFVDGREQLVVEVFVEVLDIIPRTLAENTGLDPIDSLINLCSCHDGGEFTAGLDAYTGEVIDMEEEGAVEPLHVKTQAIESATEAVVMILCIDDVTVVGDLSGDQTGSDDDDGGVSDDMGGGMGGMGGMGDMGDTM